MQKDTEPARVVQRNNATLVQFVAQIFAVVRQDAKKVSFILLFFWHNFTEL